MFNKKSRRESYSDTAITGRNQNTFWYVKSKFIYYAKQKLSWDMYKNNSSFTVAFWQNDTAILLWSEARESFFTHIRLLYRT